MQLRSTLFTISLLLSTHVLGCGDDDGPPSGADGARSDAGGGGGGTDGGSALDAGPRTDAGGAAMDAGGSAIDGGGAAIDGGGGVMDAGTAESCDAMPSFECVGGTPGGACGDALSMPVCVAGVWECPAGTIDSSLCACIGRPGPGCVCTPTGYVCDAGVASIDAGPATFACGPTARCTRELSYCEVFTGSPGSMPVYICRDAPPACGGHATCTCVAPLVGMCSEDSDGNVTVRRIS